MTSTCKSEPSKILNKDFDKTLAGLCKAISHPARVRLLKILIDKGSCISGNLSDELPLAASTVSEHLRILKEAGLIKGEIDGQRRCYCVDGKVLKMLKYLISSL
jgi:DNA-binding transcriptional ArsR family regulator